MPRHKTKLRPQTDTRIVYGAGCTYWGSIYSVKRGPGGLPACPHCGGLLYQMQTEQAWLDATDTHAQEANDPEFSAFIRWTKGRRCLSLHPDLDGATAYDRLRAQFNAQRRPE